MVTLGQPSRAGGTPTTGVKTQFFHTLFLMSADEAGLLVSNRDFLLCGNKNFSLCWDSDRRHLTKAVWRDRLLLLTDGERHNTVRQQELKSTARTLREGKKYKKDTISWEQTEAFIDNKGGSVFWASKQTEDEAQKLPIKPKNLPKIDQLSRPSVAGSASQGCRGKGPGAIRPYHWVPDVNGQGAGHYFDGAHVGQQGRLKVAER